MPISGTVAQRATLPLVTHIQGVVWDSGHIPHGAAQHVQQQKVVGNLGMACATWERCLSHVVLGQLLDCANSVKCAYSVWCSSERRARRVALFEWILTVALIA